MVVTVVIVMVLVLMVKDKSNNEDNGNGMKRRNHHVLLPTHNFDDRQTHRHLRNDIHRKWDQHIQTQRH